MSSAMMHAAHLQLDDEPKVWRDDLVLGLMGLEDNASLREVVSGMAAKIAQNTTTEFGQGFSCTLR